MNDCVWGFMGVCDGNNCRCVKYLSCNKGKGKLILEEYENEMDEKIKPIKDKYNEKFKNYEEKK